MRLARSLGAAVFVLASVGGSSRAAPANPEPDPMALIDQILGGILGDLDETELRVAVEKAGGLLFRRPVSTDFLDHAALERYLREVSDDEYPESRAQADRRLLVGLGLLDGAVDLRALRMRLLEDNVAGFYDDRPGRKRLFAVSATRAFTPSNQIILAHELRHALQDQYVDIRGVVPESVGDFDDRRLAWVSTLEGDAMVVMQRFVESRMAGALPGLEGLLGATGGLDGLPVPELPGAPAVLRDQLFLPYLVGYRFILDRLNQGGWPAVVETWRNPPLTTEQVLHPAKYVAGERALAIELDWSPSGGRLLCDGVLGELLVRSLLGGTPSGDDGAAGWGGDAYRVWDRGDQWLLVLRSRWDTQTEAAEFMASLEHLRLEPACGKAHTMGNARLFERPGWKAAVRRDGDAVTLVTSNASGFLLEALRGLP